MFAALMMSLALTGQDPCSTDIWSDACEAERRARPNCFDDNLTDRCAAEEQARVRALLGMASIEDEAAAGVEAYRAFFVDGYGQDMPAVSFERRPGRSPEVVVYGRNGQRMTAPVSATLWAQVRSESTFADRELQPIPSNSPWLPPMCLHAWVQTVEMANSNTSRSEIAPVRRRTEDACAAQLTTRFAFFLASEAVKAVPPCDVLSEQRQRNAVTLLVTCSGLMGDRLAAAELLNEKADRWPGQGFDWDNPYALMAWMGVNGSPALSWEGEVVRTARGEDKNVAEYLKARFAEHPSLVFAPRTFEGLNSRAAVIEGVATRSNAQGRESATYRQVWVKDPAMSEWMISEWSVQPFTPVP